MTNRKNYMPYPAHPELGFLVAQEGMAKAYYDVIKTLRSTLDGERRMFLSCPQHKWDSWTYEAEFALECREGINEAVDELMDIFVDVQRQINAVEFDKNNVGVCQAWDKAMDDLESIGLMTDKIWRLANDSENYSEFIRQTVDWLRVELENARKWRDESVRDRVAEEMRLEAEFGG